MCRTVWMTVLGFVAAGVGCAGKAVAQDAGFCGDGSPPADMN